MPRGVPASGKRQPRRTSAETEAPEATLAVGPVDAEARAEEAVEGEATPVVSPADDHVADGDDLHGPADELTLEQQEIKRLRDQVARLSGKKDDEPVIVQLTKPGADGNIVIHFLEDGLTALGKVWFRGQELEFEPGSRAYRDTFNRLGKSWLELAGNDFAQVEKWGKVMFRPGPWPGKTYLDGTFEAMRAEKGEGNIAPPSQEELAKAETLRTTQRAAPSLPQRV